MKRYSFILFILILLYSCNSSFFIRNNFNSKTSTNATQTDSVKKYLFLGHLYGTDTTINPKLETFDLTPYDQIWLGGDVLIETTKYKSNLIYLDSIFDISNNKTKWSLGNHDVRNGNVKWITKQTKRKTYYTDHSYGMTTVVLNSNAQYHHEQHKKLVKKQFKLLKSICDTISESSHLVILSHHVSWKGLDSLAKTGANYDASEFIYQLDSLKNFRNGIYEPLLKKVQAKGVQVIFLSGDFGQWRTGYAYKSSDGIWFLGGGMLPKTDYNKRFHRYGKQDSVIVFEHNIVKRELKWNFKALEE